MMFVIVEQETGKVLTVNVNKTLFPRAIEAPDDIIYGDMYRDGEFQRVAPRPDPVILTPAELREQAYETMTYKADGTALILWDEQSITVDRANKVYLEYSAEGSPKAAQIQALIVAAKTHIRGLYPDEE
ncbi:MAG: hypothetical protein PHE79_04710 [Eubacteriales bacterium]|nr:hypothetical protein [Eubacteriales bacterium]